MTRVLVPTHLRSYTGGAGVVSVPGATLREVLAGLDAAYPGVAIRVVDEQDRIRPHLKVFVAGDQARSLDVPITGEVVILAALSGG